MMITVIKFNSKTGAALQIKDITDDKLSQDQMNIL